MNSSRRKFFKQSLAGAVLLGTSNMAYALPDPVKVKAAVKHNPFQIGMAGYTFANFDLDTTLITMEKIGVHYLCIKDFHLPMDSTDEQIKAFHEKCASHGVTGYAVGPIYMKTEEAAAKAFDYAKRVGVTMINAVPNYELLPYVEKLVKQYDFRIVIHLHGPDIKIYSTATDAWEQIKNLDPRMGICLDIGHDFRAGCDPVADLKKYHTRIFDMHLKDVTDSTKAGTATPVGTGKIDFPALIHAMREVNYTGKCSLEYEKDMKDPFIGIAESIGYFKALCDYI